jgi:hypothetical protein
VIRRALPALVALGLLAPSTASAAIQCVAVVDDPNNECAANHATVANAVAAASPGDTVRIGPGSRGGPGSLVSKLLHFEGAGAGTLDDFDPAVHTRLTGQAGQPGLRLSRGGSVRRLQVFGGPSSGAGGMHAIDLGEGGLTDLEYGIQDVIARGSDTANAELGSGGSGLFLLTSDLTVNVAIQGSTFIGGEQSSAGVNGRLQRGTLTVQDSTLMPDGQGAGLSVDGDATTVLATSAITGGVASIGVRRGEPGLTRVIRSRIQAGIGIDAIGHSSGDEVRVELSDSLIQAAQNGGRVNSSAGLGPGLLLLRGSTVVSTGGFGAAVLASRSATAGTAIADLRNTIARTGGDPAPPALDAQGGTVVADYSAFAGSSATNGGSAPAPGSGSNFNGAPPLNPDFSLPAGSPLADRGDPGAVEPGELDLAGNPRALDGNGDCIAAPDIGAFELAALPCPPNAAPRITGFGITNRVFAPLPLGRRAQVKRGTRFRYTLSEPASVAITIERALPGRRVGRRCRRPTRRNRARRRCTRYRRAGVLRASKQAGRETTPFSGRFRRRALRRGRYRARIKATDAQGARSAERRLNFRIVKAPRRRR